jgi:hypothetical protein
MSNIVSAGISRRFEHVAQACSQAAHMAERVAEALVEDLRPVLREGETMPDLALLQELIARRLALANEELEQADHLRKHQRNVDHHYRVRLEAARQKLRSVLVDVRYVFDRTLSKELAMSSFEGRSKLSRLRSPVLERVGERMFGLLGDPKLGWDEIDDAGRRAFVESVRQRLRLALDELEAAKVERLTERNTLVHSLGNFDREMEAKGVLLRRRLRWLRGFYEGAGFHREAKVLTFRRRGSRKKAVASDQAAPVQVEAVLVEPRHFVRRRIKAAPEMLRLGAASMESS